MRLFEAVRRNLTRLNTDLKGLPTCPCCSAVRRTTNVFMVDLQNCEDPEVRSYIRGEGTDAGIVDHD